MLSSKLILIALALAAGLAVAESAAAKDSNLMQGGKGSNLMQDRVIPEDTDNAFLEVVGRSAQATGSRASGHLLQESVASAWWVCVCGEKFGELETTAHRREGRCEDYQYCVDGCCKRGGTDDKCTIDEECESAYKCQDGSCQKPAGVWHIVGRSLQRLWHKRKSTCDASCR